MSGPQAQIERVVASLKVAWSWTRAHAALATLLLVGACAALWLLEHDASLRREVELQQLRKQTGAEVAELRARAEAAMKEFRSNAQVIHDLEARRQGLAREAAELRKRLRSLREEENVRVQQAGTLGQAELSGRVTARLDPAPEKQVSGVRPQGSGSNDAVADTRHLAPDTSQPANPEPRTPDPAFTLNDAELRQVEAAFTELDSCREQSAVKDQLISNCEERVEASQAVIDTMKRSVEDLAQTVRAKDAIAARLDAQHRAELKAARGSRLRRFGRAMQYVGVGVVIGMVVR